VAVVHEAEVLRRVGIGAAASHHRASQRCIDGVAVNSRKGEHGLAVASRVADRAFGEFAKWSWVSSITPIASVNMSDVEVSPENWGFTVRPRAT